MLIFWHVGLKSFFRCQIRWETAHWCLQKQLHCSGTISKQQPTSSKKRQSHSSFISLSSVFSHFSFVYCVEFYFLLIASSIIAAWGSVQIMGRLATACNLLRFKMISCSPMGRPFACSAAVANRCNLPIMCPHDALLYMNNTFIVHTVTVPLRVLMSHL